MASLTIRPGSRIRLKGQDSHVPDFIVVRCERDQCWVRQQGWNPDTQLNVRFSQISIPTAEAAVPEKLAVPEGVTTTATAPRVEPASNIIYMDDYRRRKMARDSS